MTTKLASQFSFMDQNIYMNTVTILREISDSCTQTVFSNGCLLFFQKLGQLQTSTWYACSDNYKWCPPKHDSFAPKPHPKRGKVYGTIRAVSWSCWLSSYMISGYYAILATSMCDRILENPAYGTCAQLAQCAFLVPQVKNRQMSNFIVSMSFDLLTVANVYGG